MRPKPRVHAGSLSAEIRRAGFHVNYSGEPGEGVFVEQLLLGSRVVFKLPSDPEQAKIKVNAVELYLTNKGYQVERRDRRYPVIHVDRQMTT